jgi:gliding motility-associated-like protein
MNPVLDVEGCAGDILAPGTFTCDVGGSTFDWTNLTGIDVGCGLSGTGNIPAFPGVNAGLLPAIATIEVIATSPDGCVSDPITFTITVNPLPIVSFTGDPLQGCEPHTVTFINTTVPSSSTCTWDFGDGTTATGCGILTHEYMAGVYDVTLSVITDEGCSGTATYIAYVNVMSLPVAAFSANPGVVSIADPEVEFINSSFNADEYLWDFGDGSPNVTEESPTHTYLDEPDEYLVTLIAYNNSQQCSDTAQYLIIVEDEILFYVPNVFTPDGDQYNEGFYPVFTSGFDPLDFHLMIFNRWGELIFESYDASKGWDGTYGDRGLVQDGVYIWKIVFGETNSEIEHKYYGHVSVLR